MQSVSPVLTEEFVEFERVLALDQPEYEPIIVLPVVFKGGLTGAAVRFRPSDEERKAIADGGDIIITELTFGQLFTPLNVDVSRP